jgi:hypothetical protein
LDAALKENLPSAYVPNPKLTVFTKWPHFKIVVDIHVHKEYHSRPFEPDDIPLTKLAYLLWATNVRNYS